MFQPGPQLGGIASAIVRAQQAARAVAKKSRNDYHKYAYAGSEDVIAEARETLLDQGLALLPTAYRIDRGAGPDAEDLLVSAYLLVHTSGETMAMESVTPVIPEKGRTLDKAAAAAKTNDLSYILRGILLIPRVDDTPDIEGRDDTQHQPRRREERPAQRPTNGNGNGAHRTEAQPAPAPAQQTAPAAQQAAPTAERQNRALARLKAATELLGREAAAEIAGAKPEQRTLEWFETTAAKLEAEVERRAKAESEAAERALGTPKPSEEPPPWEKYKDGPPKTQGTPPPPAAPPPKLSPEESAKRAATWAETLRAAGLSRAQGNEILRDVVGTAQLDVLSDHRFADALAAVRAKSTHKPDQAAKAVLDEARANGGAR